MKQKLLTAAIITSLAMAPAAFAGHGKHRGHQKHSFTDTARVTNVEPIYRTVSVSRPQQECWTEEVEYTRPGHGNAAGMIIGGLIGGAIGHNVDDSHNAPLVGALIGSAIGHDVSGNRRGRGRHIGYEEQCRTVNNYYDEERLDGYRVTYRYKGHSYTTTMDHDPGDRIKVRVNISPLY